MAPIAEHGTVLGAKACTAILGCCKPPQSPSNKFYSGSLVDHDATVLMQLHEGRCCQGIENFSVYWRVHVSML
jgi:hypothetical protein